VIDNSSTDGSESILRGRFSDIEFIQTNENLGFAGGNNVGIRYALERGADYVWLLNNDTVVDPEALSELVKVADESEKTAIVGSKIFFYDKPQKIWFAGGLWKKNKLFAYHRGEGETDFGQYDAICEVDYITGCSLLIKSSVIKKVGMMDERYFLYWEEVDWNAAAYERGYHILYVPSSLVWHKVCSSTKIYSHIQTRYSIRNALYFFKKYDPNRLARLLIRIAFDTIKLFIHGRRDVAIAYVKGAFDFILNRSGKIG
jgi:GT2 family glycosyltransferase